MDSVRGSPAFKLLQCSAKVFEDLAVYELDFALGGHDRHEARNGIGNQAEALYARTSVILRGCRILVVRIRHSQEFTSVQM